MIVTHKITMDLARHGIRSTVDAVQGDKNGRQLEITLYSNNAAWNIPDDAVAMIRYRRFDGTGGEYGILPDGSPAYSFSGNVITVILAPQVCTVPGRVDLTVALSREGVEINTFVINLSVHFNPEAVAGDGEDLIEDPALDHRVTVLEATASKLYEVVAGKAQIVPEFVQTIEECTDTTKMYVLPDGYIYAYLYDADNDAFAWASTGIMFVGADGKSAYEYAVEAGYEGTEEEFSKRLANPHVVVSDDGEGNVELLALAVIPDTDITEDWVFTLEDGSTVTKQVVVK